MEMEVSYDQKRTHIDPLLHRTTLTLWLNFLIFGEAHRGAQHINESALKSQMAIFKIVFKFGRSRGCFAHLISSIDPITPLDIRYNPLHPQNPYALPDDPILPKTTSQKKKDF